MRAKVKITGEIVDIITITDSGLGDKKIYQTTDRNWYRENELDFDLSEPQEEVTIEGWVARDSDGSLNVFPERPTKVANDFWMNEHCHYLLRDIQYECDNALPSVTFENSPQEVTVTIKPKKK